MKIFLPLLLLFLGSACSTAQMKTNLWPVENGLPQNEPKLEIPEKGTELREAKNGFLYAVGDIGSATIGSPFYARFGGKWPIDDLRRPPLAFGHLVKKINENVAIVALDYKFPDAKLEGTRVTWENTPVEEHVGKGLASPNLKNTKGTKKTGPIPSITLSMGEQWGVQKGDIYGILSGVSAPNKSSDVQISKRIKAICIVSEISENNATCKLWYGSSLLARGADLQSNDIAVFLEHTFGNPASPSSIELMTFDGDTDNKVRQKLSDAFSKTLDALPLRKTELLDSALSADPTLPTFYKVARKFSKIGHPKIAVGGKIVNVKNKKHLFVNYASVGSSSGPGMNAAPPENGIDLGPIDELGPKQLTKFTELVWSSVLVNRGRTSEALIHLRYMLNDLDLRGSMRWHIRDQYAMRWAALGHTREALWLVSQDEKEAGENVIAELNALGTKVRLLDMLGANELATVASKKYLDARKSKSGILYFGALSMHIEMLLKADKLDEAKTMVSRLISNAKSEELPGLLGGIYWGIPTREIEFRKTILKEISIRISGDTRALASLRISQGLFAFEQNQYDDALLALLEAEENYVELNSTVGIARANYFMFITNLARKEPQRAFEHALKSININRALDDFPATVRMYERLAELYSVFPSPLAPGPYLGAANEVLAAFFQTQVAQGDFGKAAKALFIHGTFLTHLAKFDDAQDSLRRGSTYAIQTANFDIAALCHIRLAVIAKARRDKKTFADELKRAAQMAEISGDPTVLKIIWNIMNPEKSKEAPQLL